MSDSPPVREMVEYFLPVLVMAGDYALAIQPHIKGPELKTGQNAWTQAVTDADLSIQNFVEVASLARYPEAAFFGEEHSQSLNDKYFASTAPTLISLDPVNGTFLYKNQMDGWDIVLSIAHHHKLIAAISYMPAKGIFYLAAEGFGALTGNSECHQLSDMQPLQTIPGSRVCLTYQIPEVNQRLQSAFDSFDIVTDYDPARCLDNLNDLFTGKLDAFACRQGDFLDWGATAYIVSTAGGCATTLDGQLLPVFDEFNPLSTADMLVTSNQKVHQEILKLLNSAIGT